MISRRRTAAAFVAFGWCALIIETRSALRYLGRWRRR